MGSEVVLFPVVSHCPRLSVVSIHVGGGCWLVWPSRTKIFRNQNHRFQSKFVYCKLFGLYAGVIQFATVHTSKNNLKNTKNIFYKDQIIMITI